MNSLTEIRVKQLSAAEALGKMPSRLTVKSVDLISFKIILLFKSQKTA